MKVASADQFSRAPVTLPLHKSQVADGWRSVSGKLRVPLFDGAALTLCALAVALLSALVIGGLDRFGIPPQESFLGLNLTLIVCCLLLLLPPLAARSWFNHIASATSVARATATRKATRRNAELMGKLLIIRRNIVPKSDSESQLGESERRCRLSAPPL